jgi:hypothetical protein
MNLALAEVLLKQSGDSSLDRARAQHNHHGLTLRTKNIPKDNRPLRESAASLVAAPLINPTGERFGTFNLWHSSARDIPLCGRTEAHLPSGGKQTGYAAILFPSDTCLRSLPPAGLSLLECVQRIPGMAETTASFGIEPDIVRARLTLTKTHSPQRSAFDLVVHPGPSETLSRFLENVQFHPADGERVSFLEMPSGGIIGWSRQSDEEPVRFRITSGTSWTPDEIRFWVSDQPLNEFGFIYLAHISRATTPDTSLTYGCATWSEARSLRWSLRSYSQWRLTECPFSRSRNWSASISFRRGRVSSDDGAATGTNPSEGYLLCFLSRTGSSWSWIHTTVRRTRSTSFTKSSRPPPRDGCNERELPLVCSACRVSK